MTYYLDLTIILLILNGLLSIYISYHILLFDIKWYKYLILAFVFPLEILIIYEKYLYLTFFYLIYLLVLRLLFKDKFLKIFLLSILFKTIFSMLILLLNNGVNHILFTIYIVDKSAIYLFFLYPFLFVLTYLITVYVDNVFRLIKFKEKVMIIINDKKYIMNGYMDSGNMLVYNKSPVIFINKNSLNLDYGMLDTPIKVKTINGESIYLGTKSLIRLMSKKEYVYCYICLIDDKKDFNGCDVLLNVKLL